MRDESDGLPLLPFFMAVRAAVRAHVTATSAQSHEGEEAEMLSREARAYFDLALDLLKPVPARLVAIGGLSGSGKSSIAARIAERIGPPPGARVLSSDRTRKRLFGVAPETRLPPSAYRPSVSAEVYERIFVGAGQALVRDHGVVADAVFDRPRDRERIELTGQQADVPFAGIWLEADPEVLFSRVDSRAGGPSDATRDVVRQQLDHDRGVMTWTEVDATGDQAATVSDVLKAIGLDPTPPPAQPGGPDLKRIIRRGGSSPRKRP
jgi:hypothetical protein